jgi:hypothetical protein
MALSVRGEAFLWQGGGRQPIPAPMVELLRALRRLRGEAAGIAGDAYLAIQHHSYEPYWHFRDKLEEHAALVAVIRGRLPRLKQGKSIAARVTREEVAVLVLTAQSCLKFCFALSANPLLPIGARETFIHELDALRRARVVLSAAAPESLPSGVIDELDTALMILEEIIEKSPSLVDLAAESVRAETAEGAEPVAA